MTNNPDLSTLKSRPPWRVPRIIFRFARGLFILAMIAIFVGYFWATWIYKETSQTEGMSELIAAFGGNPGELLLELGIFSLTLAFYAGILWLISLIVGKVDQLVWLNASEEDRLHIYNQRQKNKNANTK